MFHIFSYLIPDNTWRVLVLGVALAMPLTAAWAKTVRWTGASDVTTWDIHSQIDNFQGGIHATVYESLVYFNTRSMKPEPMLATSWKMVAPQQWRFSLRQGVKFHDGSNFNADDVVFSLRRATAKTSTVVSQASSIIKVEKVDPLTVDIWTSGAAPVMLAQLTELRVMSRAWAQANDSLEPKDINNPAQITASHRRANGTGPFILKEWLPRQKITLVRNPKWWGRMEGNVTEVVYTPISSDFRRMIALEELSADVMMDPNLQDVYRARRDLNLKVVQGPETRTIMLGMDQFRSVLPGESALDRNPLRDLRVRQALYQAIDMGAIHDVIMRSHSQNTGTLVAPQVNGWTERVDTRLPFDPEASKKLLAAAGLASGFTVDFACPAGRYVNDRELCQVITQMWAKVGIKARLRLLEPTAYLPMLQRHEASIYLLGWNVTTFDALYTLQSLLRTPAGGSDGNYNLGRYSNPAMDKVIDRAKTEADQTARTKLLTSALQMASEDVAMIPLHNQMLTWVMRKEIQLTMRPDNRIDWTLVRVED
jgi:peptide/nickel transport system substrate-binding protein